jgi:hypothetical protein
MLYYTCHVNVYQCVSLQQPLTCKADIQKLAGLTDEDTKRVTPYIIVKQPGNSSNTTSHSYCDADAAFEVTVATLQ